MGDLLTLGNTRTPEPPRCIRRLHRHLKAEPAGAITQTPDLAGSQPQLPFQQPCHGILPGPSAAGRSVLRVASKMSCAARDNVASDGDAGARGFSVDGSMANPVSDGGFHACERETARIR